MVTEAEQDQNRLWTVLAYGVVPATGGKWYLDAFLHLDEDHPSRIVGLVLASVSDHTRVVIETPEEYEAFIAREVPDA